MTWIGSPECATLSSGSALYLETSSLGGCLTGESLRSNVRSSCTQFENRSSHFALDLLRSFCGIIKSVHLEITYYRQSILNLHITSPDIIFPFCRYGRRPTILLMVFLEVPLAIASCFATSFWTYVGLRVAGGLFFPALYQLPFILALELMPPGQRNHTGNIKKPCEVGRVV